MATTKKTNAKDEIKKASKAVKDEAKKTAETVKDETKKVAKKAAESGKEAKSAVKETAKKTAKSADTAKKAVKDTAKKVEKSTKSAVNSAKKSAKSAAQKMVTKNVYFQFSGKEIDTATLADMAEKDYINAGGKASSIKSLELYVKAEDSALYYVVNNKQTGKVNL